MGGLTTCLTRYTPEVANTVINMFSNQHWSSKPQTDFKAAIDDWLTMGYEEVTLVLLTWELNSL